MFKTFWIALGALSLSACATGTTNLSLGISEDAAKPALLSEVSPEVLVLKDVKDSRKPEETARIGNKRNGYGMVMGAIGTKTAPTDTVADVITKTLEANGHSVTSTPDGKSLEVSAELTRFWLDYKTGFVTVEFFGDVQINFSLTDPASGEIVFSDQFKGYYSDKTGGGLSKTWTRVMDAALADLSKEISMSAELMEAIDEHEAAGETAADVTTQAADSDETGA
ncbi:MAG: hypothetical protein V7675_06020 [Hyphomonas sp.]|uniref:hypothetical protein n=1 Tax=Hyphomonas sp. TaxID=87 RepID=UPI003003529F